MSKTALISVSDKTGIDELAAKLISLGYKIISTGGTAEFLKKKRIKIIPISDFTKFEEILEGRVKTLHPKIHAGILAKSQKDLDKLKNNDYSLIDIVIVNLYPFEQTIQKRGCTFDEAIENIDIGGPTLLRASAKNHKRVTVITDPNDYDTVLKEIEELGEVSKKTKLMLATKVFKDISKYDQMISSYLGNTISKDKSVMEETLHIEANEYKKLRYGENPHQKAKLYDVRKPSLASFNYKQLTGKELSFNNLVDTESAFSCVEQFSAPSCVIVKHANPCGAASGKDLFQAYKFAYLTDPTSAFGGIITFNNKIEVI